VKNALRLAAYITLLHSYKLNPSLWLITAANYHALSMS